MPDPHVERLYFRIVSDDSTSYRAATPLLHPTDLGTFVVRDERLVVELSGDFSDKNSALAVIEPFLRTWEAQSDLVRGVREIRFEFERADVIDRDRPEPGMRQSVGLEATISCRATLAVSVTVARGTYPSPPCSFTLTPNVESMYLRWLGYLDKREPLPAMANFVLTVIGSYGGLRLGKGAHKRAARVLRIERDILSTIGYLAAEKGDRMTARKAVRTSDTGEVIYQELSPKQRHWLETAVRRIIQHVGTYESGDRSRGLTMADLPDLPPTVGRPRKRSQHPAR